MRARGVLQVISAWFALALFFILFAVKACS
jgi:hypothetical protein